jgi:hypothetical protein
MMKTRSFPAAVLLALVPAALAHAQGPLQRAGQTLDNAGRNIRLGIEGAVARGQVTARERQTAGRVLDRLRWDKRLQASMIQVVVRGDGSVVLRGSASDDAARKLAAETTANTVGVTTVVDEMSVVKQVKVIGPKPAARIVDPVPPPADRAVVRP